MMFKKKNVQVADGQVTKMVEMLQQQVNAGQMVTASVSRNVLAMESISDGDLSTLNSVGDNLQTALEAIAEELGIKALGTKAQIAAGAIGGLIAGDYRGFLAHKVESAVATESMAVVDMALGDSLSERSFGLEAYNEQENRNAVIYSIAYNYQAARQDEFGETFFPTITLTPDQVGFGVAVNLMMVYDGIERKISGSFEDWKKKNIIRAVANPSVLKKEQTRVIPVYRAQSADKFCADVTHAPMLLEEETIDTAPLAFGKKVDLLGLSQTEALLARGVMDQSDTLDPSISLQNVYVKFGADVVKFSVGNLPYSNFVAAVQGNYRLQNLSFTTTSVLLNKDTKCVDGADLADLAAVVTGDYILRLEMQLSGNTNIETGETSVFGNMVSVHSVQDAAGNLLPLDSGAAAAIVAAVNAGKLVGYDVLAYRSNANLRQRGQRIDTTRFVQMYNVPLRSPISTMHPINVDGQIDASDVQALITATRIRTSNEAVTALINAANVLREFVDARDASGVGPDVMGAGRFFVLPAFKYEKINMDSMVDSVKSHERAADIQAVLVNKLRDMAYHLYRDSEYKAAADALAGGIAPVPEVIIGTDPVIARYINITGDLRTLGGEFNVRVVSTLDQRMKGKIFMAFGVMDETRNTQPNPMNFGNMVWAPEVVVTANISNGGQISKETVVQPRYLFVTHCPIMGALEVDGIPESLSKVPLFFHQV